MRQEKSLPRHSLGGRRPLSLETRRWASYGHAEAKKADLDLSAEVVELDPKEVLTWQEVDEETVDRIARRLSHGWLDDMPLVVVGRLETGAHEVVDGNHRRAAAIQAGLGVIPVVAVNMDTVSFLLDLGLHLDQMMETFALENEAMDKNQDLRWISGEDI